MPERLHTSRQQAICQKDKHTILYLEYRGYLWTNVAGETGAYYFYYNNANLNRTGLDRATGAPIRCMKAE